MVRMYLALGAKVQYTTGAFFSRVVVCNKKIVEYTIEFAII